jgi:hypothetical protein
MVCAYLSVALLIRLLLNALAGWWWADPVAAPAIAALAAKEIEKLEAWLFASRSGRRCLVESRLAVCSGEGVAVAGRATVPVETQRGGVVP